MQPVAGLTLIEVIVSIAIFAMLSIAVLGSLPGILKVNSSTRDDQGVTVSAKAYLENVRAKFNENDPLTTTTDPATGKVTTAGQTNFDAGTLPTVPSSSQMNGYTCAPVMTTLVTTPATTGAIVTVRRMTLTCTQTAKPTQTFVVDFARPL